MAAERRIVRVDGDGAGRSLVRRSPKRASVVDVFDSLWRSRRFDAPALTIEVLLLREDHVRSEWSQRVVGGRDPGERRLIDVLDRVEVREPGDVVRVLPALPSDPLSTPELAALLGCSVVLAQRAAYCLRAMGIIEAAGSGAAHRCTDYGSRLRLAP